MGGKPLRAAFLTLAVLASTAACQGHGRQASPTEVAARGQARNACLLWRQGGRAGSTAATNQTTVSWDEQATADAQVAGQLDAQWKPFSDAAGTYLKLNKFIAQAHSMTGATPAETTLISDGYTARALLSKDCKRLGFKGL
jgi:hypothetical protein